VSGFAAWRTTTRGRLGRVARVNCTPVQSDLTNISTSRSARAQSEVTDECGRNWRTQPNRFAIGSCRGASGQPHRLQPTRSEREPDLSSSANPDGLNEGHVGEAKACSRSELRPGSGIMSVRCSPRGSRSDWRAVILAGLSERSPDLESAARDGGGLSFTRVGSAVMRGAEAA